MPLAPAPMPLSRAVWPAYGCDATPPARRTAVQRNAAPPHPRSRRHRPARAAAAAAIAALIAPASGWPAAAAARPRATRTVALVDVNPRISAHAVRKTAAALQRQANEDLRPRWPGPRVNIVIKPASTAGSNPWELVIAKPLPHVPGQDSSIGGVHGLSSTGEVSGAVFPNSAMPWTISASHELLEMLEDPTGAATRDGYAFEICDPVQTAGYYLRGVLVSDFVAPGWFTGRGGRPWDYLGLLHHPRRELAYAPDTSLTARPPR